MLIAYSLFAFINSFRARVTLVADVRRTRIFSSEHPDLVTEEISEPSSNIAINNQSDYNIVYQKLISQRLVSLENSKDPKIIEANELRTIAHNLRTGQKIETGLEVAH
jgi:hypothetical protein